jgi:hypothetical protein
MNTKPFLPSDRLRSSGLPLVRSAAAIVLSRAEGRDVGSIFADRWPHDRAVETITRAATAPATSVNSELVVLGVADFVGLLSPMSASAALLPLCLQLEFGPGRGPLSVHGVAASAANVSFVQEGKPIPVLQVSTTGGALLFPKKLAAIAVFTRELFQYSTPNIEALVRAVLSEAISCAIDAKMLDANAGDDARPAGLRYNIAGLTASTQPAAADAISEDVGKLAGAVASVAGNAPIIFIAAPAQAMVLKAWSRTTFPFPILASSALAAGTVMVIASNALVTAADPLPRFQLVDNAVLHFDDTTPRDIDTAAVATTVKSLWQSDLIGLRTILEISWGLRSANGVAWMTGTNW